MLIGGGPPRTICETSRDRRESVVEGFAISSFRPHAQVQAPFGRQTCSRHDIVERTEAPSGRRGSHTKPVIAEMIIVVVEEDVEDEPFKSTRDCSHRITSGYGWQ